MERQNISNEIALLGYNIGERSVGSLKKKKKKKNTRLNIKEKRQS